VKFILYTMAGSVLMLVAILTVAYLHSVATGSYSFDYEAWLNLAVPRRTQVWLFLAFAVAFAIKVPLFPFHTWLPDAHVEAPTAGSVILAGVLLKMGTYGYLRFAMPLFPNAAEQLTPFLTSIFTAVESAPRAVIVFTLAIGISFYLAVATWAQEEERAAYLIRWIHWGGFLTVAWTIAQSAAWAQPRQARRRARPMKPAAASAVKARKMPR